MKLGLHLSNFTWRGAENLRQDLAAIAQTAEEAGYDRISVMDHVWQIGHIGPPEHEMLEAYTTLGFLAAHTSRVNLMTLVTGVTYRDPGLLAKIVTTLDVLSGGRAWLGIGAAWNAEEAEGLGLFLPPVAERFERLEETLRIVLQMWSDDDSPYQGQHYTLGRTLNSPQPLRRPHPPILIGGSGERKTLRLVAKYAQACNIFQGPEAHHKLAVLREHCDREGRDYDAIQKTVTYNIDVGEDGEKVDQVIGDLRGFAEMGFEVAHGSVTNVASLTPLEIIGEQVIPAVADL